MSAVHLAPSAYLVSFAGCTENRTYYHLVSRSHHFPFGILPSLNSPQDLLLLASCHIDRNRGIYQGFLPLHAAELLATAPDPLSKARLLSASKKESDSWLHTLPVTSLGLRMDDNTLRIAIGLRLGTPLCIPHLCYHCGANVDTLGSHGLSFRFSAGRHFRHAMLNDPLPMFLLG